MNPPEKSNQDRPPVISLVKGGLGNQMFCYAAGRALALRLGRPLRLDVRTGYQRDDYGRSYRLSHFSVISAEASLEECLGGDTRTWKHKIARTLAKWQALESRSYLAEGEGFTPELFSRTTPPAHKPIYLNGYWQNEEFFGNVQDRIRKELMPPVPQSEGALQVRKEILSVANPVMLHVRRERLSPRLLEGYYNNCVEECLREIPDASFFVFGDDLDWAVNKIAYGGAAVRIMDRVGADEIEDLHLMTCCRHAIIANSTFSWWGAWLGQSAGQQVWAPATPGWQQVASAAWRKVPNELEYD